MSKKILFITVGGSPKPIITAIQTLQAQRVIFICSTGSRGSISQVSGEGKPCEVRQGRQIIEKLPNLPTHLALGAAFNPDEDIVGLDNPDEPAECYKIISEKIAALDVEPRDIAVDYTGGTKSMSLALAMAALDQGIELYVTTADRRNLLAVERNEMTTPVFTASISIMRVIEQFIPDYLAQYNYQAAMSHINEVMHSTPLLPEHKRQLRRLYDFCCLFDVWDRFDHAGAYELTQDFMKLAAFRETYGMALRRIIASRREIDPDFALPATGKAAHGYEIVEDLLLNAARRAAQNRFDDAVGRLYRALELTAQIHLLSAHHIHTGAVPVDCLPPDWHHQTDAATVKLGLLDSYRLLQEAFPDDSVSQVFAKTGKKLQNCLGIRNRSLFAHGFQPVSEDDYKQIHATVLQFIQQAVPAMDGGTQFPTKILDGVL
ncbi:TIGR02710 family CRISPR-associated CARF protein [Candidatus Venteria ishoeyi]|uniref:CRISPR-associated protein (Cas_Cas02710) n=1 Tax=Candidatus Venteria ishoeyi TaxID=1899563 RepID=A0A1H6F6X0_9GAMM|nr:TIGR02710 family CRISPR-associated CARF protein [Candidatus Venteria ishoeyi]SEH05263.1 CRISPR-associated protein (Cas_Cas02710) [Candidatus Venteria ishoeyi]